MNIFKSIIGVSALAGSVLLAGSVWAETEPDAAIQYRKALMGTVGGNMKASALIIKGQVEHKDALAAHARGIAAAATLAPAAFKQDTHGKGSEKTTSNANIWKDWDKFSAGLKALETEATKLADLAASGDMEAAGKQLGAVGKTCKGCHDANRDK
ncbi:cytochrome c [Pelagibius sp. Alg239-R121]|uniref:c-type cytochrome n=1 Tax=Pelagibius sp. Alg239-R121 TaxID=2993448 RepID=UPI0024A6D351|nr:cytochrome c [Pelagibius sp. Alg239-R121]